jgi:hypothetical protein
LAFATGQTRRNAHEQSLKAHSITLVFIKISAGPLNNSSSLMHHGMMQVTLGYIEVHAANTHISPQGPSASASVDVHALKTCI